MKLEEAIEILTRITDEARPSRRGKHHEAIKLGIEALKEIKKHRTLWDTVIGLHLPGETED